jgi:hypothetical protein
MTTIRKFLATLLSAPRLTLDAASDPDGSLRCGTLDRREGPSVCKTKWV